MWRLLPFFVILAMVVLLGGCGTTGSSNTNNNSNTNSNSNNNSNNNATPLAITGTVTGAGGATNPALVFTGGTVTISAVLSGTIPTGTTVAASVTGPQPVQATTDPVAVTLAATDATHFSGDYDVPANADAAAQVYTFAVAATPPQGTAVTAAAGQATISGASDNPPGPPGF